MGELVVVERGLPTLELPALGAGKQEPVGEWNRRCSMSSMRVHREGCRGLPVRPRRSILQRPDAEERLPRLEDASVSGRHRDLEAEAQTGSPVGEVLALRTGEEAALPGHNSGQDERYRSPDSIEMGFTSVEAMGLEPTNLLHAMQALYQLSYAPEGRVKGISRPALV
jgi:hypothetical protein